MSRRKIHVENLMIRLPQSASASARAIAGGLGREILQGIADATRHKTGTKMIGELSTGKIVISRWISGRNVGNRIAGRVAAELAKRFES